MSTLTVCSENVVHISTLTVCSENVVHISHACFPNVEASKQVHNKILKRKINITKGYFSKPIFPM